MPSLEPDEDAEHRFALGQGPASRRSLVGTGRRDDPGGVPGQDRRRIGDQLVRQGECVSVSISSANRDPSVFHHPDELRLVRPTSRAHLAFGYGPHQCLGSQLARVLVQEGLTALFSPRSHVRLAKPRAELVFTDRSPVHGLRSLPVMW